MAQTIITKITSDLSGSEEDARTVNFAYGSQAYEIDLTAKEEKDLLHALDKYISAARKVKGGASAPRRSGGARSSRSDLDAIRAWGSANGFKVSERGRLSKDLVEAYDAAQGK